MIKKLALFLLHNPEVAKGVGRGLSVMCTACCAYCWYTEGKMELFLDAVTYDTEVSK